MNKLFMTLGLMLVMVIFQFNLLYGANMRIEQEVYFPVLKEVFDFLEDLNKKDADAALKRCDLKKIIHHVKNKYKEEKLPDEEVLREYLLLSFKNPSVLGLRKHQAIKDNLRISIAYDVTNKTVIEFFKKDSGRSFCVSFILEQKNNKWIIVGGSYFEYLLLLYTGEIDKGATGSPN